MADAIGGGTSSCWSGASAVLQGHLSSDSQIPNFGGCISYRPLEGGILPLQPVKQTLIQTRQPVIAKLLSFPLSGLQFINHANQRNVMFRRSLDSHVMSIVSMRMHDLDSLEMWIHTCIGMVCWWRKRQHVCGPYTGHYGLHKWVHRWKSGQPCVQLPEQKIILEIRSDVCNSINSSQKRSPLLAGSAISRLNDTSACTCVLNSSELANNILYIYIYICMSDRWFTVIMCMIKFIHKSTYQSKISKTSLMYYVISRML